VPAFVYNICVVTCLYYLINFNNILVKVTRSYNSTTEHNLNLSDRFSQRWWTPRHTH